MTNAVFDSQNLAPHLVMARRLTRLVKLQASNSALCECRNDAGILGDGFASVKAVLPITRFDTVDDVERIANLLELAPGDGPANVRDEMPGIFYELALNAVQHAQSGMGCYAVAMYGTDVSQGIVYAVGVADCGIGIPASLRGNPDFAAIANDAEVIVHATELHVTGTGEVERGLGLDHVMGVMQSFGGNCVIIAGGGYMNVTNGSEIAKGTLDYVPGTVVVATIHVPAGG